MTIAHLPVSWEALFAEIDAEGNTIATPRAQVSLASITPLAALELYEQLHAARNALRRERGLAEIPTPDSALLCLAFLRRLQEEPATSLRQLLERFDASAQQIQMNRAEEEMNELDDLQAASLAMRAMRGDPD